VLAQKDIAKRDAVSGHCIREDVLVMRHAEWIQKAQRTKDPVWLLREGHREWCLLKRDRKGCCFGSTVKGRGSGVAIHRIDSKVRTVLRMGLSVGEIKDKKGIWTGA
jgi:hypothetical protein